MMDPMGVRIAAIDIQWLGVLISLGALAVGFLLRPFVLEGAYAVLRRFYIRRRLARLERAKSRPEPDDPSPSRLSEGDASWSEELGNLARDPIRGPRIYVSSIQARNFRCFPDLAVRLRHPGDPSELEYPNVNLVIGDNGSGKSTLLKAIAIAALGPVLDSSGFVPFHLIRSGHPRATLQGRFLADDRRSGPSRLAGGVELLRQGDYEALEANHSRTIWSGLFDESNPAFLVVGYGVNRRTAADEGDHLYLEQSRRRRRYQRVASLFDESAVLVPLSSWLPGVDRRRRAEVERILGALLPAGVRLASDNPEADTFEYCGQPVPYPALSDGYRSFIGWVGDLLFQINSLSKGELPLDQVGGIVLVDEVDLLLHPSWQRQVVPRVAAAFPEIQFVFTTHSPIVAGTLQSGNILLARVDGQGRSGLERLDASIHGLNAEQILLSSYFELDSTRALGTQGDLGKLAERAMKGDDGAAVDYLRVLAKGSEPGKTSN